MKVKLTRRELEVLEALRTGKPTKQIADSLVVSKRTVDFHLANLYKKLKVGNSRQALFEADRLGLLPKAKAR